jgi:uncharacterized protein (UPF0297 family)
MDNKIDEKDMETLLKEVYEALCEKGYDPARQIAGYILSEDPVYITDWKNARGKIVQIDRDRLLLALVKNYFEK